MGERSLAPGMLQGLPVAGTATMLLCLWLTSEETRREPGWCSQAPEGGMSGDSPCRDGDSQRGHWDRQWLGSSTSPEPWVTSPGMAANLSKSALALPAPHGRQKEPGEKLQRPGNGGAEPAPASPHLCLSPSITGLGSLPSWQCQERDHPGPGCFLGERGCLEQAARGLEQGWDPMGATGLHGRHRQPPAPRPQQDPGRALKWDQQGWKPGKEHRSPPP